MLLSHIAAGLGSKKIAPRVSLCTLILASELADVVWILLVLLGIEHFRIVPGYTLMSPYDMYDSPFSHGLLSNLIIAVIFSGIYFLIKKDRRSAIIIGFVVLSHWILDFISHRPDMVLIGNSGPFGGLELWRSYWGTLVVEIGLLIVGLVYYISSTKARRTLAFLPLILFVLFLVFMLIGWLLVTPSDNIIGGCVMNGIVFLILFTLAYWTDTLRDVK